MHMHLLEYCAHAKTMDQSHSKVIRSADVYIKGIELALFRVRIDAHMALTIVSLTRQLMEAKRPLMIIP